METEKDGIKMDNMNSNIIFSCRVASRWIQTMVPYGNFHIFEYHKNGANMESVNIGSKMDIFTASYMMFKKICKKNGYLYRTEISMWIVFLI